MMRHHVDDVYMTSQPITVQTDTSLFKYMDNNISGVCFYDWSTVFSNGFTPSW